MAWSVIVNPPFGLEVLKQRQNILKLSTRKKRRSETRGVDNCRFSSLVEFLKADKAVCWPRKDLVLGKLVNPGLHGWHGQICQGARHHRKEGNSFLLGSTLNIIGMMTKLMAEGKCFYEIIPNYMSWESCWIEDEASDWGGEKVQKRFLLAEQGSPPQYCFKKVVIQKLSSTECSLEFVLTEEKKTELGLGEQYSERDYAGWFFYCPPPPLAKMKNSKEPTRGFLGRPTLVGSIAYFNFGTELARACCHDKMWELSGQRVEGISAKQKQKKSLHFLGFICFELEAWLPVETRWHH